MSASWLVWERKFRPSGRCITRQIWHQAAIRIWIGSAWNTAYHEIMKRDITWIRMAWAFFMCKFSYKPNDQAWPGNRARTNRTTLELVQVCSVTGYYKFIFCNHGAGENAPTLKFSDQHAGRPHILQFHEAMVQSTRLVTTLLRHPWGVVHAAVFDCHQLLFIRAVRRLLYAKTALNWLITM